MMNAIWLGLVVASVVTAAFAGTMPAVTAASVDSAKSAVTLAIGLIGVMAFWLGMMRVVQEGGLLRSLARMLRPVMVRLFPDVPPEHPAMSAMIMNIATNMLGLGNAATPFGIKAMIELDRLNPRRGVATDAMVLFLAINTSNVAVAPLGVIALRASIGSADAAGIWIPTVLATSLSTVAGIAAAKLLQRLYRPVTAYATAPEPPSVPPTEEPPSVPPSKGPPCFPPWQGGNERGVRAGDSSPDDALDRERPTSRGGCVLAWLSVAALGAGFALHLRRGLASGDALGGLLRDAASSWLLPVLIVVMLGYGMAKRVAVYDAMITGAREGFEVAVRIIPFLVAIVVAAGMFRASGLLELVVRAIGPLTDAVGFPAQAIPMAILRPLSGSGAYAVMAEIMQAEGPDSRVGYLVSVLQGSSETTFYVLAVYFGAVAVTRVRHAVAAGLIADLSGVIGAVLAVNWLLG